MALKLIEHSILQRRTIFSELFQYLHGVQRDSDFSHTIKLTATKLVVKNVKQFFPQVLDSKNVYTSLNDTQFSNQSELQSYKLKDQLQFAIDNKVYFTPTSKKTTNIEQLICKEIKHCDDNKFEVNT